MPGKGARKDGYPTVAQALTRVAEAISDEDQPTHSVTVQLLASGEVTYKQHLRGEVEARGGYLPPPGQG